MKRLLCTILALLLLCGCGAASSSQQTVAVQPPAAAETETEITFTDDLGRSVTVDRPQRVAVLLGSFAEIWCLAGGDDSMVATANDAWTSFDGLPLDGVANLGSTKDLNLEQLIAAQPDFIVASTNTQLDLDLEPTFEQWGVPAAYFTVEKFEDYLRMLDICTRITGNRQAYEDAGLAVKQQVEQAKAKADGSSPRVLYLRATSTYCRAKNNEGSVLGEMLADLDAENIADSETGLLENLSMEVILAEEPEYIFVVYHATDNAAAEEMFASTVASDPAWASLKAVQEGRCYVLDPELYNLKPNARWGEAYEQLAEILYPAA